MSSPVLSIILPAYNAAQTLSDALQSIQRQTFNDFEVIVVDDGSTDGTGEIAESFAHADSRFRVIHKANSGGYMARLTGIGESRGTYLGFMDADDVVTSDFYEKMMGLALEKNFDVVQCDIKYKGVEYCGKECGVETLIGRERVYADYIYPHLIEGKGMVVLWDKVYRRTAAFDKLISSPIFYFDDHVMNWQLFSKVESVGLLHEPLYTYTGNIKPFSDKRLQDLLWTIRFRSEWAGLYRLDGESPVFYKWTILNASNFVRAAIRSPRTGLFARCKYAHDTVHAEEVAHARLRLRELGESHQRERELEAVDALIFPVVVAVRKLIADLKCVVRSLMGWVR